MLWKKCKHCFGGPVHHNVSENVVFQISKKCENNSNLDIMSRTMRVIIKLSSKLIIIEFFLNTPCRQIVKSFGDLKKWIILVEAYENQNTDIDHLTFCQIYDLIVIHHKTQNFTFFKSKFHQIAIIITWVYYLTRKIYIFTFDMWKSFLKNWHFPMPSHLIVSKPRQTFSRQPTPSGFWGNYQWWLDSWAVCDLWVWWLAKHSY